MINAVPAKTTNNKTDLVPDVVSSLNKKSIAEYTKQYGAALPVATVDLIESAFKQQILSEEELVAAKLQLQKRWSSIDRFSQSQQLCPLILADHEAWIPENIHCYENTEWLRVRY